MFSQQTAASIGLPDVTTKLLALPVSTVQFTENMLSPYPDLHILRFCKDEQSDAIKISSTSVCLGRTV